MTMMEINKNQWNLMKVNEVQWSSMHFNDSKQVLKNLLTNLNILFDLTRTWLMTLLMLALEAKYISITFVVPPKQFFWCRFISKARRPKISKKQSSHLAGEFKQLLITFNDKQNMMHVIGHYKFSARFPSCFLELPENLIPTL